MNKNLYFSILFALCAHAIMAQSAFTAFGSSNKSAALSTDVWYHDQDSDGYGNPADSLLSPTMPTGYVANNLDCNDQNAAIHPNALEICGNGIDEDCDGISAVDTIAPLALCLPSKKYYLNSAGSVVVNPQDLDGGSSDNCSTLSFSADTTVFNCDDWGIHMVTLRVSDVAGNSSTCMSVVKIAEIIPPTAICRENFWLPLGAFGTVTLSVDDVDNGSYDNCALVERHIDETNFTCADLGIHTITLSIADEFGNTNSCQTLVNVADVSGPIAVCDEFSVVALNASGHAHITAEALDDGSYDACSPVHLSIDSSDFYCADLGVHTITLTVTDDSGNSNNCFVELSVTDKIFPTAACVPNLTLALNSNGMLPLNPGMINNGSSDNCDSLNLQVDPAILTANNMGTNIVTLSVTDATGNTSTCSTTIQLVESITAIQNLDEKTNIKVSPNPSKGRFELRMPEGLVCEQADLFNADGQWIMQENKPFSQRSFDLSGQPSGCYYLRIHQGDQVQVLKLTLIK